MDTIRARARRHADRNGSYVDVVSLDEPTLDGRSLRHEVADPRAQTAEIAEDLEQIRLVAGLPKKERYVLLRTQVDGATAEEVGRELGVSADRVYALAANGATRLRRRAA
jgi:DNA-directed RNA polymerase specialized sigma24 family protein